MCLRYIGGLCFTGKGRRIKYQGEKSKKWSDRFFCDVICLTAADSSVLGIVRSKRKIQSLTHPRVVPNLFENTVPQKEESHTGLSNTGVSKL